MNETTDQNSKDFSLSFIQVVCAIAVIMLHTNGCFWSFSATESYWFSANIIECICYFAVPVFFMITGITLLNYLDRYSTREYFIKRAEKTLIPYLAWSLIGIVFKLITGRVTTQTVTAKWVINGLLSTEGIVDVYWFFQPLFCVYLSIPLFAAVDKNKKDEIAKYLLLSSFLINILFPFLNNILNLGLEWPYRIAVNSGYLFWVWGGYYIYNNPPTRHQREIIYVFSIIGLLMHIVGTYTLSISAGSIQSQYKGYFNIPCVLYTFGVFLFLQDLAHRIERYKWIRKFVFILGQYTFPAYLIHWFILLILNRVSAIDTRSIYYRLLMPFAIFFVIVCLTWCLRKIPGLRKIVP